MKLILLISLHLAVFLVPFADRQSQSTPPMTSFQQWPETFEGQSLQRLPITAKEQGFSQGFPGKIARFTDGSREIIMRYIEQPSRKLHPSADCLRGAGYTIEPQPVKRDQTGELWGCVLAKKNNLSYRVCERISDQYGNSWYDVSSWFWSVLLKNSQGSWWAITIAEEV